MKKATSVTKTGLNTDSALSVDLHSEAVGFVAPLPCNVIVSQLSRLCKFILFVHEFISRLLSNNIPVKTDVYV